MRLVSVSLHQPYLPLTPYAVESVKPHNLYELNLPFLYIQTITRKGDFSYFFNDLFVTAKINRHRINDAGYINCPVRVHTIESVKPYVLYMP